MQKSKSIICVLAVTTIFTAGCRKTTENKVTESVMGRFKVDIRSQEFNNSGIHNVDVCLADSSQLAFPTDKDQCVMHGYDISGLSVKWQSDRDVDISFDCGRITTFSNYASVPVKGESPAEFHVHLRDKCEMSPTASQ